MRGRESGFFVFCCAPQYSHLVSPIAPQVKADRCHIPKDAPPDPQLYGNFSRALNATGRPMLFSLCNWGEQNVEAWGSQVAQLFRFQMDHLPIWKGFKAAGAGLGQGTLDIINFMATLKPSTWVRQFGYGDPDFLQTLFEVDGVFSLNYIESRTEFSFWAAWSAPLIFATDPRNATTGRLEIWGNKEVIAVNQDPLLAAAERVALDAATGAQVWARPLSGGDFAVLLFNPGEGPVGGVNVTVALADIPGLDGTAAWSARDLWAHDSAGVIAAGGSYTKEILPRDIQMLRLAKQL
jgi:alpha-galactosidase